MLAEEIRSTAAVRGATVTPRSDHPILTDDHAPLEWLTVRFLRSTEADRFSAGNAQSIALAAVRTRQRKLLLLVGLAWLVALLALGFLVRAMPPGPVSDRS